MSFSTGLNVDVKAIGTEAAASEVGELGTAVEGVGTATEETSAQTSKLRGTLKNLATGFAVYKGYQFIKSAVNETTSLARNTLTLTRVTGMDAKASSAWLELAGERNLSAKQLNTGFITLSKQLVALSQGSTATATAFQSLGLSQKDLAGKSTQDALGIISDKFAKLPAGANKAALAQKLFGRSSQQLLPLISQGSKAIDAQVGAMEKHLGVTNETIKNSLELVKTQREWQATMTGLKVSIATALLPLLVSMAQILTPIAQAFSSAMQSSGAFRIAVVALTFAMVTWIAAAKLAELGIGDLTLSIGGMEIALAPILALVVGVGIALVLLYKKCGWFRDGVNAIWAAIKAGAVFVFNWIKGHWPLLAGLLFGPFGLAAAEIIQHWNTVKATVKAVFDWITGAASSIAHAVAGTIGGAFSTLEQIVGSVVHGLETILSTAKKIAGLPGKALGVVGKGLSAAGHLIGVGQHGLYAGHGGTALVGEHGPELVDLPQGSRVAPFGGRSAAAGGHPLTVHTHVYIGKRQIALAIGDYVADVQAAR